MLTVSWCDIHNKYSKTDRKKRETEINRQVVVSLSRTRVTALALSKLSPRRAVKMFLNAEVMYSLIKCHKCRCLCETQSW